MKLTRTSTVMNLEKETPYPLSSRELQAANTIADAMRDNVIEGPVGLYIWKVCKGYGVDHRRVARHLGSRNRMRKPV